MKKRMLLACALTWAGANAAGYEMKSYVALDGKKQEAFAWCDSPSRVLALIQYAVPATTNAQTTTAELHEWPKTAAGLGKIQVSEVQIGAPDPGAGQIYTPLKLTSGPRKGQSGYYHTSNIENTNDPAYRMTKTGEFKLGNDVYKCRYVKDATFIGVTQKRTVIIWNNDKAVTYATRNFDGSSGVYVTGGTVEHDDTGPVYLFETSSGYSYIVTYDQRANFVQVLRGNKVQSTEHFLAYSSSSPKP